MIIIEEKDMKKRANEFEDLEFKIYKINDEPDYVRLSTIDITEYKFTGYSLKNELKINDYISGVIEEDNFRCKIRFEAIVTNITQKNNHFFYEIEFTKEVDLPEFLIAKSMAIAI